MKPRKSSVKVIKESPSSLAFSSPAKRKLLADLTAARANVKNKFTKAYMERKRREREMDKIFKPITKKLDSLTTTTTTTSKKKNDSDEKKKEEEEEEEKLNDDDYFDDSLGDSAFASSQFNAKNNQQTPKADKSLVSPARLHWSSSSSPKGNDKRWGSNWRRSTLNDLLRQTQPTETRAFKQHPLLPRFDTLPQQEEAFYIPILHRQTCCCLRNHQSAQVPSVKHRRRKKEIKRRLR